MKKTLLAAFFLISLLQVNKSYSQEWLGIANSNYAGVTGINLNPASMVGSRMRWDLNIIGGDFFVQNNYVYIPGVYSKPSNNSDTVSAAYKYMKDYYTPNPQKNVFINIALRLPSVMFRVKKHTFAITTGYRYNMSVNDLEYHLAKFAFEEKHFGYTPQHNQAYTTPAFKIATMAWAEVGVSYGYPIYKKDRHLYTAAISIKRAFANAGIYILNNKFDYTVTTNPANNSNSDLTIHDVDMQYGHAMPTNALFTGGGFGFDVGVIYEHKQGVGSFVSYYHRNKIEKYQWKAGLSMIDIGAVTFKTDARVMNVNNSNVTPWSEFNKTAVKDLDVLDNNVSTRIYADATKGVLSNQFNIGFPTAISGQVDINLNDKFYLNTTIIQSAPLYTPSIIRPSQASVALRYETKYFEATIPYSLYNYKDHRIGLGVRMGYVIIGTDKLGSLIGLNDFTGTDFYFALKLGGLIENIPGPNPNKCFYKRIFKKFSRKKAKPKGPVVRF